MSQTGHTHDIVVDSNRKSAYVCSPSPSLSPRRSLQLGFVCWELVTLRRLPFCMQPLLDVSLGAGQL